MKNFLSKLYRNHFYGDVHAVHATNYVIFIVFCWLYLFVLQRDVIHLEFQRMLSVSVTNVGIIALLCFIFVVVIAASLGINSILKLKCRYHALSFFPLFSFLAFITLWVPTFCIVKAGLLFLLLLLYVVFISRLSRGATGYDNYYTMLRSNLVIFIVSFVMLALLANFNEVLHYELKVERYLAQGRYEKAMGVAKQELATSKDLQALRAYSLAKQGRLAEALFEYPVDNKESLFLQQTEVSNTLLPVDSVVPFWGFVPAPTVNTDSIMLRQVQQLGKRSSLKDYWLCSLLLRKDLPAFVSWLPRLYDVRKPLPRYYTEALVLYNALYVHSSLVFHNAQAETNYADYKELSKKYTNKMVQSNYLRRTYGDTYWWYYMYW